MKLRLNDFDAITFDVYGALIDWEPSIIASLGKAADRHDIRASVQDLLVAFDRGRAEIQQERPAHLYPEVLSRCFDCISAEVKVPVDPELKRQVHADTSLVAPIFRYSQEPERVASPCQGRRS